MRCERCGKRLFLGGAQYERLRKMHYRCILPSVTTCKDEPERAFCSTCPDHEACATGVPVTLVRAASKGRERTETSRTGGASDGD